MNTRQRRLLSRIFAQPTPADLRWSEIEALLRAAGAEISEGAGSRARVALRGIRAVFHRPHPSPVRAFLTAAGLAQEDEE